MITPAQVFPRIDPNKLCITSIRVLGANVSSNGLETIGDLDDLNVLIPPVEYQTEIFAKNTVNIPNKEFITFLTIKLEGMDINKNKVGVNGEFKLEIKIRAEDLNLYLLPNEEKDGKSYTVIHNTLTGSMVGIAYSTCRGIVFMRTLGTALEGVILPIVDPLKIPGVIAV